MWASENIDKLAPALAEALPTLPHAKMDSANQHFKSRFASLQSLLDTVRGPLADQGLTVLQLVTTNSVRSVLMHTSGQWVASECPIVTDKQGPQALGSAITYARRYSLSALVAISADEDDDANGAERPRSDDKHTSRPRGDNGDKPQIKRPDDPASDAQRRAIWACANKAFPGRSKEDVREELRRLCETAGFPQRTEEMTKGQASIMIQSLEGMAKAVLAPNQAGPPDDDLPF